MHDPYGGFETRFFRHSPDRSNMAESYDDEDVWTEEDESEEEEEGEKTVAAAVKKTLPIDDASIHSMMALSSDSSIVQLEVRCSVGTLVRFSSNHDSLIDCRAPESSLYRLCIKLRKHRAFRQRPLQISSRHPRARSEGK